MTLDSCRILLHRTFLYPGVMDHARAPTPTRAQTETQTSSRANARAHTHTHLFEPFVWAHGCLCVAAQSQWRSWFAFCSSETAANACERVTEAQHLQTSQEGPHPTPPSLTHTRTHQKTRTMGEQDKSNKARREPCRRHWRLTDCPCTARAFLKVSAHSHTAAAPLPPL